MMPHADDTGCVLEILMCDTFTNTIKYNRQFLINCLSVLGRGYWKVLQNVPHSTTYTYFLGLIEVLKRIRR